MDPGNTCAHWRRPAAAIAVGPPASTAAAATGVRRPGTAIAAVASGLLLECLVFLTVGAAQPLAGPGVSSAALATRTPFAADSSVEPSPVGDDSLEEFAPRFDPSDWDSVTAAYDTSVRRDRGRRIAPIYGLRFNKAEGLHLEAGGSLRDLRLRITELELRAGYDLGRERPVGAVRASVDFDARGRWGIDAEAADQVRPFGNHHPYGNTWLTLFAGYDAMQYQRERRFGLAVTRRFSGDRLARFGWVRLEQDSLRTVTDAHVWGAGDWMERNGAAEPFTGNGLRLHLRRGASYEEETAIEGLITETELMVFGGELLRGTREFSRLQADAWYTRLNRQSAAFCLYGSASLATGDAPRQAWPDLGGAAGLRAFSPRGERPGPNLVGAQRLFLVGTQRLFLRAEVRSPPATLRVKRVKALRNLGLKLVPFAEAGAVWGLKPGPTDPLIREIRETREIPDIREIREWRDLRAPRRSEVHSDLGIGLRRDIGYSGILSYVEIDVAWPMGADTGPPRITVQFSRDGLD
jgi:hypothetical protein